MISSYQKNFLASVFNLMNSMIGAGVLALPFVLSRSGMLPFGITATIVGVLTFYSSTLLLDTAKEVKINTLEGLSEEAYGKLGRNTAVFAIFQHCFSGVLSYCKIILLELPEAIDAIAINIGNLGNNGDDSEKKFHLDNYIKPEVLLALVLIFLIFPVAALKYIRFLGTPSSMGMVIMYILGFIVVYKMFTLSCGETDMTKTYKGFEFPKSVNGTHELQTCEATLVMPWSSDLPKLIPCLFFSFIHQESLMPVFSELKPSDSQETDVKRMKLVDAAAVFFVYFLYMLVSFAGYQTFYNYAQDEFLLSYNIYDQNDILILFARICVLFCVMVSIPLLHYAARKTVLLTIFGDTYKFSWKSHLSVMVGIIGSAYLLAVWKIKLTDILSITGSIGGSFLIMIFPASFYLKLVPKISPKKRLGLRILAVSGWVVMFLSLYLNFLRIYNDYIQ